MPAEAKKHLVQGELSTQTTKRGKEKGRRKGSGGQREIEPERISDKRALTTDFRTGQVRTEETAGFQEQMPVQHQTS